MQPQPGTMLPFRRRADAGSVRLTDRDSAGLILCGEQYGAPYDLLAAALDVRADRLRGIVARWRKSGYAQTGTLATGPAWCWLTSSGMKATGLGYPATRPSLGRLAHIRAVLAVRLWLESGEAYQDGPGVVAQRTPHPRRHRRPGQRRARAGRGDPLAQPRRLPLCGADLGHRGGTDRQAAGPHGGHHAEPARPHQRLRPPAPRRAGPPGTPR